MSKFEFDVTQSGDVILKLEGEHDSECVEVVLSDIGPLIQAALEARSRILGIGSEVPLNRIQAASALELKAGIGVHYVTNAYKNVADLLDGSSTAEELGFPEFSDDSDRGNSY